MNFNVGDRVSCFHSNRGLSGATGTVEQILPKPICRGAWAGYVIKMDREDLSNWLMEKDELTKIN